ncbi:D-alanyl-D-alanine carboxypeptidase family protein [Sporosarcina beigongshangi]|uniref:D-alanyl-D-alanine carboxypeptidase family protein n=1 Tax=Sporosarcina beigongshangi TaxID=2782538 RepID=UPI001939E062|nr:D-alanyl-D-alanine carboxypeptidase family protein [Sporosarcina beigongshangi]
MKKLVVIVVICALSLTFVLKDKQLISEAVDMNSSAKASILMEAETGEILYENNSKQPLPIASMSKLMTQYLVLNAINNGTLTWESTYEPSDYVQQMSQQAGAVKLGMVTGSSYTVEELFIAMTVSSANDAAMALAEMVSGTEEAFVAVMNKQANSFKLKETTFYNASGLDGDYIGKGQDETNLSSARDVAVLAQQLIATYPEVLDIASMTDFTTSEGTRLWSTNLMLPGMPQAFPGIDGLKTGYTDQAGSCFVSTGVFEGRRIITVVMGVEAGGNDTTNPRFELTKELIEQYVMK